MTPVFIDALALLSALNTRESCHGEAASLFANLASQRTRLQTTSPISTSAVSMSGSAQARATWASRHGSVALLEELGLREALAFDHHFTDRGFALPL